MCERIIGPSSRISELASSNENNEKSSIENREQEITNPRESTSSTSIRRKKKSSSELSRELFGEISDDDILEIDDNVEPSFMVTIPSKSPATSTIVSNVAVAPILSHTIENIQRAAKSIGVSVPEKPPEKIVQFMQTIPPPPNKKFKPSASTLRRPVPNQPKALETISKEAREAAYEKACIKAAKKRWQESTHSKSGANWSTRILRRNHRQIFLNSSIRRLCHIRARNRHSCQINLRHCLRHIGRIFHLSFRQEAIRARRFHRISLGRNSAKSTSTKLSSSGRKTGEFSLSLRRCTTTLA